ncbi:hypothetical protein AB6A40_009119 [Gnathostoma spinigerum]|uniref:Nucleolar protein 8 n=1 Tax=Gnathostoma spinigerum TaxID=75299 RepID=A0ABD6F101_9BILA
MFQLSTKVNRSGNLRLFDSESDEEEADDLNLKIENRHFGEKGAKLMEMEARFGNDERFRLNERFQEDGDDAEENKEGKEVAERKEKRKAELSILSKVLGKPVRSTEDREDSFKRPKRVAPFVRFDPDNPEHLRWLKEQNEVESAEEEEEEVEEGDKEDVNRVIEGRFVKVDKSFLQDLKSSCSETTQNGKTFSFLASIGRSYSSPVKQSDNSDEETVHNRVPESRKIEKNEQTNERLENDKIQKSLLSMNENNRHSRFFLMDTDLELTSVAEKFYRKQDIDTVKKKWSLIRKSIIKVYKARRKAAIKKKKLEESNREIINSNSKAKNASMKGKKIPTQSAVTPKEAEPSENGKQMKRLTSEKSDNVRTRKRGRNHHPAVRKRKRKV